MNFGGQRHVPAALSPEKRRGNHFIGGWVGPRAGMYSLVNETVYNV